MGCSNGTAATTEEFRIREKECSFDATSAASTASTLNCRCEGSVKKKSGHSFNKIRKTNPATEEALKRLVSPEIDEALFNLNGLEKTIGLEGAKPMPPDRKLHDLHVKKLETYMKDGGPQSTAQQAEEVELLPRSLLASVKRKRAEARQELNRTMWEIPSPASAHNSSFSLQREESGVSPSSKISESEPVIVYNQNREAKEGCPSRMRDIVLWDVAAESGIARLTGHVDAVTSVLFWEAPDAPLRLISASKDRLIRIWSVEMQICVQAIADHRTEVWSLAMNAEQTRLVAGTGEKCCFAKALAAPSRSLGASPPTRLRGGESGGDGTEEDHAADEFTHLQTHRCTAKALSMAWSEPQGSVLLGLTNNVLESLRGFG
eukprot:s79_g5.t1